MKKIKQYPIDANAARPLVKVCYAHAQFLKVQVQENVLVMWAMVDTEFIGLSNFDFLIVHAEKRTQVGGEDAGEAVSSEQGLGYLDTLKVGGRLLHIFLRSPENKLFSALEV